MFDNNPITKLLKDQEDEIKQSNPSLLSTPEQSPTKLMEKFDETQNPIYKEAAKSNYKGLMSKFGMGAVGIAAMATPTGRREIVEHAAPIVGKAIKEAAPLMFQGFKDISSTVLEKLTGRSTVSKQFIEDTLKQAGVRAADADMVRKELAVYGSDKIDVTDFAQRVKDNQILPVEAHGVDRPKYENVNLPEEIRGDVTNYQESIYQSPVKTMAGDTHFDQSGTPNYFAHTRTEDVGAFPIGIIGSSDYAPNGTRRVLEIQSDLFQKGNLDREKYVPVDLKVGTTVKVPRANGQFTEEVYLGRPFDGEYVSLTDKETYKKVLDGTYELRNGHVVNPEHPQFPVNSNSMTYRAFEEARTESSGRVAELAKLKPYENTWHERIAREEIKRAGADNMTKLQFPTGETAMQIEGLGGGAETHGWTPLSRLSDEHILGGTATLKPDELTPGLEIKRVGVHGNWFVTDVIGDGRFRAVPEYVWKTAKENGTDNFGSHQEMFDISDRTDKDNPIYKFYESELAKFLKSKFNAKRVVDDNGVSWFEVDVKPYKDQPVLAHGAVPANILATGAAATAGIASIFAGLDKAAEKNKETYVKKEVTPSEKQAVEKERKEKEFLSLVDKTTKAIAETETGGVKTDRYLFARDSGNKELGQALGKYQITEGELQTYEKRFLEADVTPHEFLTSPELQDTYMKNKVAYYLKQGYTPTEVYDIHYNGIRKAGEPGSGVLQDPEIAGRFDKLFTQAK